MLNRNTTLLLLLLLIVNPLFAQQVGQSDKAPGFHITDSGSLFTNPPFQSCHSATITETGKDTLLYAWFGGDYEGAKNVVIWGRYRYLGSKNQWGPLQVLASGQDASGTAQPCWNPVLFKTASGVLFLDYKVGPNPREWWAERKVSYNNGKTWSAVKRLPEPFLGPIKNKPIQLKNGTILYPSSTESRDEKSWQIHLETTDASGGNWQYQPIPGDSFGVIQPTLLQYGGDTLQMLCRSRQNTIVQTWSYNSGRSWTPLRALAIPNPNSGIDAVTLRNGWQLLVYNPMQSGKEWWLGRSTLKVAVSKDGTHWQDIITLEDHLKGEYSYPAVIQDGKNRVRIAYTDNRKNIRFVDLAY
jgi:predicted neuraminidase